MSLATHALHNEAAGQIVRQIVFPTLQGGGEIADVMVLTESVVLGVLLFGEKMGGDVVELDAMLESLTQAVRERWRAIRIKGADA
ncbi:hypothetical protein BH11PSE1_BH11PSE1_10560 [soil metagenome]